MSEIKSAVVAGHLCLDIIPAIQSLPGGRLKGLLQPGHLLEVGPMVFSTGGAVSNTGVALHKLGIPTRLVARLGTDTLGETVRTVIRSHGPGLDEGICSTTEAGTSYTIILNLPGVDRFFWHYPGTNDIFGVDDIPYDLLAGADLFHFGYPPLIRHMHLNGGSELVEMLRRAKATGVTTSIDMALPDPGSEAGRADWPRILSAALPWIDIFTPSIDELLFTLHRPDYERLVAAPGGLLENVTAGLLERVSRALLHMGPKVVLIKLGAQGAYLHTADEATLAQMGRAAPADPSAWAGRQLWAPCFQVQVVGTTGAGDATIAGFLSAWLRGLGPEQAMTAAVAVGACNVEAADALSGIRSWEATLSRVAAGWPRLPMAPTTEGWHWDAGRQLLYRDK